MKVKGPIRMQPPIAPARSEILDWDAVSECIGSPFLGTDFIMGLASEKINRAHVCSERESV